MVSHNDLLHKGLALSAGVPGSPRVLKIPAGILRHLTILKHHAQIPELIILHINILYVQQSFCPLQYGGCKNLSQRNVHIGHTVLEISLLFPVP